MRTSIVLALAAAAFLLPVASAHGGGISLELTDQGCVVTDPPCIIASAGAAVTPGEANEVTFTNGLDEGVRLMFHLDADGEPGALVGSMTNVAAGETIETSVQVPADASGVWYMTLDGESNENARLFGGLDAHSTGDEGAGEDSPGLGVVVLGVLAVAVAARRS